MSRFGLGFIYPAVSAAVQSLLLRDGSSHLLLRDNASKLLITTSSTVASLPDADALDGTELLYADGLVATVASDAKVTTAQIKTFINGLTLIDSGSLPAANSKTFTGLATYDDIILILTGASHNNGANQSMTINFSSDGTNFAASAQTIIPSQAASVLTDVVTKCFGTSLGRFVCFSAGKTQAADPSFGNQQTGNFPVCLAAACSDIKLVWSAGNFDAGTYALYGK